MENTDFVEVQKFLEQKGYKWEKDKDCLWAEETTEIKIKDLFSIMEEYKIFSFNKSSNNSLLEQAILILDDYLNAGCKETRKLASEKAKSIYKQYYGIDYVNRNSRRISS